MGCLNSQHSTGPQKTMELLHGANHIRQMLYNVNGSDVFKRAGRERPWKFFQVDDDIGTTYRIGVNADGAWMFVDAATYVESARFW